MLPDGSLDLTHDEMISLLAGLLDVPAGQIGGWAVVVRMACGAENCRGLGCEAGPMRIFSAAATEDDTGEAYTLHMLGSAVNEIASTMEFGENRPL